MQCCVCQEKTATVHVTRITGDKLEKSDLCADCARVMGLDSPTNPMPPLDALVAAAKKAAGDRKTL